MGNGKPILIKETHPIDTLGLLEETIRIHNMIIWKRGNGRVRFYCTECQRYESVPSKEWWRVRQAGVCPLCFNKPYKYSSKTEQYFEGYFTEGCEGYKTCIRWEFGRDPEMTYRHVFHRKGREQYRKGIVKGMCYTITSDLSNVWKKCRSDYSGFFYRLEDMGEYRTAPGSKRKYYEDMRVEGLKTDQERFIRQGVFNKSQVQFIQAFDLHDPEDVYKHARYIKRHLTPKDHHGKWNRYTLDYLDRYDISPLDYRDYEDQCKELGFKPDKPKDFRERHEKYSQMVETKRSAEADERIMKRIESLMKFQHGNVVILPFASCEELIQCGKTLHNCIGSYTGRYKNGECDLYHMDIDGVLTAAIEIRDGKLIQARADHNQSIRDDEYVKRFMREIRKETDGQNARTRSTPQMA